MTDTTTETVEATASPEQENTATLEPTKSTQQADAAEPAETEESAPSEPDSGDDSTEETQPKKKGGGFQKRIDKLTQEKYDAELRLQQMERQMQEMQRKLNPPAADTDPGPRPTLNQFDSIDDYDQAMEAWAKQAARYEAKQATEKAEAERKQAEEIREFESLKMKAAEREAKLSQKYADFDTVLNPQFNPLVAAALQNDTITQYYLQSEAGPEVAYHLAKNPTKFAEVLSLPPIQAIRELTRLEMKLSASPPPKTITNTPPPIKPVGARDTVAQTLADLAASDDASAYIRKANAARPAN